MRSDLCAACGHHLHASKCGWDDQRHPCSCRGEVAEAIAAERARHAEEVERLREALRAVVTYSDEADVSPSLWSWEGHRKGIDAARAALGEEAGR